MRILEINTEQGWRGGEKQTLLTVEGLLKKGHQVTLVCTANSVLHKRAVEVNIPFILKSNIGLFFYLLFQSKKIDIIHTHTAKALTACSISTIFHSTPVVFSRRHYKTPTSWFSKWKYNQASYITTVSGYIKSRLVKANITAPIEVIYDASIFIEAKSSRVAHMRSDFNPENKKIIATIAAFEEEKDPHTLVEAITALHQQRTDFIFIHFGSGKLLEEIKQLVADKNLQSTYLFAGQTQDVEELYSLFDVFVMSSKNEGLGSSVIDAFLNQIPVVSTDAGGLKELVMNRGYVAEKENPAQLASAIQECLTNNNTEIVSAAYSYATTVLATSHIQDQYERLFLTLTQPAVDPTQS
jgi:glycosyltransferase involved in cell wall biosynthesis